MKQKFLFIAAIAIMLLLVVLVPPGKVAAVTAQAAIVYVDDDFDPSTPGWGVDHFATIQDGVDAVDPGGLVNVAAGDYFENITITQTLELAGAGQADVFVYPAISNPDCSAGGGSGSLCGGGTVPASNIFLVQADDVIIHGFTLDGNNPNLSSGITCGDVDIDARNGIIENYPLGVFDNLEVYDTNVLNIFLRGIYASSYGTGFNFHDNTVQNVQCDYQSIGIFNFGGSGIIANNTVDQANDAIAANWSKGTQFLNNTVTNSGSGVHTDNSGSAVGAVADVIQGNTVTCDGLSDSSYGVWTFVTYLAPTVTQNTVTDCAVGLSAWGEGSAVVTQFTDNIVTGPTGIAGTVGAYITTDIISWGYTDVSVYFEGNILDNFETGIYLTADEQAWNPYPYVPMTLSATFFDNSITNFVYGLDMGTQGTYIVDASANWWGTNDPAEVKAAVNGGVIADYSPWFDVGTDTSPDPGFQGDFGALWVDDDSTGGSVSWIQEGVNLALDGGTVHVAAGTYQHEVWITKDLSLLGAGQVDTIIQAYAGMPSCFTTSYDNYAIVCIKDAEATIDGFTINGQGLGNSNYRFEGVAFRNAGGGVQNSAIINIQDTPFSGSQHGVAVYVYNDDEVERTVQVLDNTITDFQKNAMALNAGETTPLIVDVQRNVISGAGTTTVTAQNGIQVWADMGTGLVANNTVDGIAYDGGSWVATSILNYYGDLEIISNTITGGHVGIYNIDGSGLIANNDLTTIEASGYAYGIVATDPPGAKPSPYDTPVRSLAGKGVKAVLDIEVVNNSLVFDGPGGGVGIEADGGYGEDDISINVHHNSVTGFDYGLLFYQGSDSTGVFTDLNVVSNDLFDNTMGIYLGGPITTTAPIIHHNRVYGDPAADMGLYSGLTATVTAENNWFGCNEGPGDISCLDVSGLVDADPWLVLSSVADPGSVTPGGNSLVTSDLIFNSDGADTSVDGYVPDGIRMDFSAPDGGVVDPLSSATLDGASVTTFTAPLDFGDYQVCTTVDSELVCVTVTVWENFAPVAVNDTYTTTEEADLVVAAPGVLDNDTDANGDPLTAVLVTDVSSGTLTLDSSGAFTYTPDVDFFGVDSFTYMASDGTVDSNIASVIITVTNINDLPVAVDDYFSLDEDTTLTVTTPGILENDYDVDGDTFTAALVSGVSHGTLTPRPGGGFIYTPEADYFGSDNFTYRLNDGHGYSNVATVFLTINGVNDAPVAVEDAYSMDEDTVLTITAPGVLFNDTDIEGDVLTATLISDVSSGTLVLNADGSFTYTPNADFFGTDSFTYLANDGNDNSNVVTVTITVADVPEEPGTQYFYLPMVFKFQP